ncbi:MAG: hypothetical protein GXX86_07545, partial [Propionibacterium sp.]|nr:hypothetical protein [Propionibacterium sp.]
GRWSTSQVGTSGSNGSFSLPLTYGANTPGSYAYRVIATAANGGKSISPTVTLARTNSMEITVTTAGIKKAGEVTNVWGTVSGGSGRPVQVQVKLPDGRWSTSQVGTSGANGFYALRLTYGASTPGTYTYRVVATAANGGQTISPPVTLTRTR